MSEPVCLLVDDERLIRAYLRAILQPRGFICLEAGDAGSALTLIRQLGGRLDLLVTDISMPGQMDGIDLARVIRSEFAAIGIVLVSAYAGDEKVMRSSTEFAFVAKPFVADKIWKAVTTVLPRSRPSRAESGSA